MTNSSILNEGIELYNRGRFTEALAFFISLPEDETVDPVELSYYLGLCYAKMKRYDDAILYIEQVVTSFNESSSEHSVTEEERVLQSRYLLAVLYSMTGRKKLADFELNKLLDVGYKVSSVYASMAFHAWEQGNSDLSISYYEKALDENGDNPTALNGLGYVLASEGIDLARALSSCKKALEILPDNAAVLDSLGWVYYKMGLYKEAEKYLRLSQKKDNSNPILMEHIQELQRAER